MASDNTKIWTMDDLRSIAEQLAPIIAQIEQARANPANGVVTSRAILALRYLREAERALQGPIRSASTRDDIDDRRREMLSSTLTFLETMSARDDLPPTISESLQRKRQERGPIDPDKSILDVLYFQGRTPAMELILQAMQRTVTLDDGRVFVKGADGRWAHQDQIAAAGSELELQLEARLEAKLAKQGGLNW